METDITRTRRGGWQRIVVVLALITGLFVVAPTVPAHGADPLPVVPGLKGFGTTTPAGRGGRIIHVDTLASSGPGSLRSCLAASGKRVCVFDVAGVIDITQDLRIENPYVTVAGQTAPSPGITIIGAGLKIKTHDVLVQHLRIRPGDRDDGPNLGNRDAVTIAGNQAGTLNVRNVVVDHLSLTWSTDEVVSTWYPNVRNITISNSIIGEALREAGHPEERFHSMGLLAGADTKNIAITDNLFINNEHRNPSLKNQTRSIVANNLIVNPRFEKIHFSADRNYSGWTASNIVGNALVRGPNTQGDHLLSESSDFPSNGAVYFEDNVPSVARLRGGVRLVDNPPVGMGGYQARPASEVQGHVVANVGARPADRDAVDTRLTDPAHWPATRLIDSQDDVEGFPPVGPPVVRPFVAPSDPHGDRDGDGYTNLEERLHEMADEVENGASPDPTPTPDPTPGPDPDPTPDVVLRLGRRDTGRYGCNHPTAVNTCERLLVEFPADGDSHTLRFKSWDIERDGDIAIYLNGEFLADMPAGVNNAYSRRVNVQLPGNRVDDGRNVLEFRRERVGSWGVKDLRVDDT